MYLLAILIPLLFCAYMTIGVFDLFVPIMGRSGTQTPPDVFIAVLCALAVVMLFSYVVSAFNKFCAMKLSCTVYNLKANEVLGSCMMLSFLLTSVGSAISCQVFQS